MKLEEDLGKPPEEDLDAVIARLEAEGRRREARLVKAKATGRQLAKRVAELEADLQIKKGVSVSVEAKPIRSKRKSKRNATAVAMLSDIHWGETIDPKTIFGVNEYDAKIAEASVARFFESIRWHIDVQRNGVGIRNLLLVLGGDLITGSIHDELLEINSLGPIPEAIEVQAAIKAGIEYLLEDASLSISVACVYGNHGRITQKRRHATGARHSIERYLYSNLAAMFEGRKRLEFTVADGAHIYVPVYDSTIRVTHGDDVRYGGGVGGISIAFHKAVKSWDTIRRSDLTLIGHFHQLKDFGFGCVNGSVCGYGAYALSIKAEWEPPRQMFLLWDERYGKTMFAPILTRSKP